MSSADVMAIVLFLFFLVGVAVGVLAVIALSARRAHQTVPQDRPVAPPRARWPYLPEPGPGESEPGEPPWWQARSND